MGKTLFDGRRTLRDEDTGELIHTQVIERVVGEGTLVFTKYGLATSLNWWRR